jgi:septin family protein
LKALTKYFILFFCSHPERLEKTVDIESSTVEIEERGVKLKLTVVDTPGFGDSLDNSEWYI